MTHFRILSACLLLACLGEAQGPSKTGTEGRSLFDGKTFEGWEGDTARTWRVEHGALTAGSLERAARRNEFLATTRRYGDFDLRLRFKIKGDKRVNAGVQFRSKRIPNHHEVIGYQADIGPGVYGHLYDESRRRRMLASPDRASLQRAVAAVGKDGWQSYRIRAVGPRIQLWLNGVQTVDHIEKDPAIPRTGFIAVQIHGGMQAIIAYKDIVIRELSATGKPTPRFTHNSGQSKTWKKAEARIGQFKYDKAFKVTLFADSSHTEVPAAICFDDQGRLYAAESRRFRNRGIDDNRDRKFWLLDDLALEHVDERKAMYQKWQSKFAMATYTKYADQVVMIEDHDRDGRADSSIVFAGGFNDALDGPAIGLISRDGKIYLTCIPSVWELEDTDGDRIADKRRALHRGFGVRVSISGHDLHGLAWGPDGKLYWSLGDRGYNLTSKEGEHFFGPNRGAVFRCDPDGSNLELVYTGLRNPQELAFDQFGNLFTVDNNADHGDRSRLVYILEGGEAGWRSGWQIMTTFKRTAGLNDLQKRHVPWWQEKLWHTQNDDQPAYILPCLAYMNSGPSGLVFHSTPVMGDRYANSFYVCDYLGGARRSGVHNFKVANRGAGFEIKDFHVLLKGVATTDVDFGYDGKLYVADWGGGWTYGGRGNIFTISKPGKLGSDYVVEAGKIFREGFTRQTDAKLAALLSHVDMRLRQRAQFELAKRDTGKAVFTTKALRGRTLHERLHSIWGLGQMARRDPSLLNPLLGLLDDSEVEVRANCARVFGDNRHVAACDGLIGKLEDQSLRVRHLAAIALGKLGRDTALQPLVRMIAANDNKDRFLRHSGVEALARLGNRPFVYSLRGHPSDAVRLATVLVLRKWRDVGISKLLGDSNLAVSQEAIRAINDNTMTEVMPALAGVIRTDRMVKGYSIICQKRVLNANLRTGGIENASAVLKLIANNAVYHETRKEGLRLLGLWHKPPVIDPTIGQYRPLKNRIQIEKLLAQHLPPFIEDKDPDFAALATDVATAHGIELDANSLISVAKNRAVRTTFRTSTIESLSKTHPELLRKNLPALLTDRDELIRATALRVAVRIDPEQRVKTLLAFLNRKDVPDQRAALDNLAGTRDPALTQFMCTAIDQVMNGTGQQAIYLEIIGAAEKSPEPAIKARLSAYRAQVSAKKFGEFDIALHGGDKARGKSLFHDPGVSQCTRCHRFDNRAAIGPNLRRIGKQRSEAEFLRAMLDPSADITPGFAMVNIETKDGVDHLGALMKRTAEAVTLKIDGKNQTFKTSDIKDQTKPMSVMLPMATVLTKREIRDLISYLMSLK